jgi:hypothetical protein
MRDLQCEEAVVDLDLLGEEIGADGGLVLVAEPLVHVPADKANHTPRTNQIERRNRRIERRRGRVLDLTGSSTRSSRPCQEAAGAEESETGNRCGEIGKGEENRMAHPLSPRMMTFRSILRRVAMDLGDRTQRDETRGAEGMDAQIPLLLGNLYFSPACQLVSSVGALRVSLGGGTRSSCLHFTHR